MRWLKHAFAVDPPGAAEPTPEQADVIDRVCREVVRRRMVTPALMSLELCRPLNYVGSQTLHFFAPVVAALTDARGYQHFAEFLERRGSVDYLCQRLEDLESGQPS